MNTDWLLKVSLFCPYYVFPPDLRRQLNPSAHHVLIAQLERVAPFREDETFTTGADEEQAGLRQR